MGHGFEGIPFLLEECDAAINAETEIQDGLAAPFGFTGQFGHKGVAHAGRAVVTTEGEHIEGRAEGAVVAHGHGLKPPLGIAGSKKHGV